MKCKYFHIIFLIAILFNYSLSDSQPLSFTKVNTGTHANIVQMQSDMQGRNIYILANRLYKLSDSGAVKIDFIKGGPIRCFCPDMNDNFWLSYDLMNYNSSLYHYIGGTMQNIITPFSNTISYIYSFGHKKALMAGLLEIMIYDNGRFYALPPLPQRASLIKCSFSDTSLMWMNTSDQKLYQYKKGVYKEILQGNKITDFCSPHHSEVIVLSGDALYKVVEQKEALLYKNNLLKDVLKIHLLEDNRLLMVGKNGLILTFSHDTLTRHHHHYNEMLHNIVATKPDNIWISGQNGIILYSGSKKYTNYPETKTGFSIHDLIPYSVPLNNEYGVAMADYNGDKKTDIYAVRIYEQNRLYINCTENDRTNSRFDFTEEVIKRNASGVVNAAAAIGSELKLGVATADIDNDGDQDIYLCYLTGNNRLLINKGDGNFRNVSQQKNRACDNSNRSNAAAFSDVDNDGDLDLFVTNENGSNRLFENDGTGHYNDITATSGLASQNGGMCASFADVNNDGLPDLAVSFWHPENKLYINETKRGKIFFRDITASTDIIKVPPAKSNAVSFADINNDGYIDLFIANRNAPNKLYINNSEGNFIDKTNEYFKPETLLSNGAVFADFDLDGFVDLYLTNVGDNILYRNVEGKRFEDVTALYGAELSGYCTGSAIGDIDNDGDPDLYIANYINGNSKLLRNNTEHKTFLKIFLRGVISNKDAIGAKVWLYKKINGTQGVELAGFREISGGGGYASSSAKEIIFGCEKDSEYFALVKFPCTKDTFIIEKLTAGNIITLSEASRLKALIIDTLTNISIFIKNRENHPEFLKVFIVAIVLLLYNIFNNRRIQKIDTLQWTISGIIFVIFVTLNGLFLFQWPMTLYFTPLWIAFVLLIISHLFISRYVSQKQAAEDRQRIRTQLSRDLHDELASTLGSISIYSNTFKNAELKNEINLPQKIATLSHTALQSISDIIWMTSPRNDTLQSVVAKLNSMMYEVFGDNAIHFTSNISMPDNEVLLDEKLRNNVFLILKESFHNILKHAKASEAHLDVNCIENKCFICLTDNGVGITHTIINNHASLGNGLHNMQSRAKESNIDLSIIPNENDGTSVVLKFRIR